MRAMMLALVLGALVLGASACGGYGGSSSGSKSSSTESASSGGKTEVEMDDYYFDPKVIKGKPGETVTLELKNEGKTDHNFTVDGQGIDTTVSPDASAEVSVTIPKSGSVAFYCKFHKSQGMTGMLEASGSGASMSGSGSSGTGTSGSSSSYGSG
jgi:plastocyanin